MSARVVFGEEPIQNTQSNTETNTISGQAGVAQPVRDNVETPDDVRIDKIFNFSNHKFD